MTTEEAPKHRAEPGSLLHRLRETREANLQAKTLVLELPGWSGLLHVRYKPIPWEDTTRLLTEVGDSAADGLKSNAKALIAACDALLVKTDEGELVPLADELRRQGETVHGDVRFDEYACDALGLELRDDVGKATATVLAVFGGAISPELAIAEHAARIATWMRGVSSEVDADLLGG